MPVIATYPKIRMNPNNAAVMPIGMQLLNSHDEKWEGHKSEQRRKHAENDANARGPRRHHRIGDITSNDHGEPRRRGRGRLHTPG